MIQFVQGKPSHGMNVGRVSASSVFYTSSIWLYALFSLCVALLEEISKHFVSRIGAFYHIQGTSIKL